MLRWLGSREAKAIVEALVAARMGAGLTQRELAKRLGLAPSVVAKIELGERRVDVIEFIRIAEASGVDGQALFARVFLATR